MGYQLHAHWTDSQSTSADTQLIARALLSVPNRQIVYHLMCHRADTTPFNLLGVSDAWRFFPTPRRSEMDRVNFSSIRQGPLLGSWAQKRKWQVPASPPPPRSWVTRSLLLAFTLLLVRIWRRHHVQHGRGLTLNPHSARTVSPKRC